VWARPGSLARRSFEADRRRRTREDEDEHGRGKENTKEESKTPTESAPSEQRGQLPGLAADSERVKSERRQPRATGDTPGSRTQRLRRVLSLRAFLASHF
jgi:hypothetical protein